MPHAAIIPAITGASSLVSGIGGKNAQKKAQAGADAAGQAQSKLLGAEASDIDAITKQYFGQAAPTINHLMQYLGGSLGQSYNSPFTQGAQGAASKLGDFHNPYQDSAAQSMTSLQGFKGLKPEEMAALQTNLGNSGRSSVNTLMSRLGGTPNPNALAQDLLNQNNENALNSTVQLGSMGAQQELGALQSAGQLGSGLSGQVLQGLGESGQLLSGLSGQNLSYQQGNQGDLLSLLGQQSGLLGSALSGTNQIAGQYGFAGAQAAQNAASAGNPWASALGGVAGSGLFGGGGSGGSTGTPQSPLGTANAYGDAHPYQSPTMPPPYLSSGPMPRPSR